MLVRASLFLICEKYENDSFSFHTDSLNAQPFTKHLYTDVSMKTGAILSWKDAGIEISVPPGAISPHDGISCDIAVIPLLHGDFRFPDNSVAVSGIYAIGTSCKLAKPLTIHMEHCVQLSNEEDVEAMNFYKAEHGSTAPPPYEFIPCDGGKFSVGSQYGSLDCQSFTLFTILRRIRSWITGVPDPTIRYRAQVLYATRPTDGMQIVYIFVLKNLINLLQVCH